jgi:hypothetical protein
VTGVQTCALPISAILYASGHGYLFYIDSSEMIPTIYDAARNYFSDEGEYSDRRLQLFVDYLSSINYYASITPGNCGLMKAKWRDPANRERVTYPSSECVNLMKLYEIQEEPRYDFDKLEKIRRDTFRPEYPDLKTKYIDIDGDLHDISNKEEMIAKKLDPHTISVDGKRMIKQNQPFWARYTLNGGYPNKKFYFKAPDGEDPDLNCFYGLHIPKIFGIDEFRAANFTRENYSEIYKRQLLEYAHKKNINIPGKLYEIFNKIFSETEEHKQLFDASINGNETCTIFDVIIIFFELGIFMDLSDPTCSPIRISNVNSTKNIAKSEIDKVPGKNKDIRIGKYYGKNISSDNTVSIYTNKDDPTLTSNFQKLAHYPGVPEQPSLSRISSGESEIPRTCVNNGRQFLDRKEVVQEEEKIGGKFKKRKTKKNGKKRKTKKTRKSGKKTKKTRK